MIAMSTAAVEKEELEARLEKAPKYGQNAGAICRELRVAQHATICELWRCLPGNFTEGSRSFAAWLLLKSIADEEDEDSGAALMPPRLHA